MFPGLITVKSDIDDSRLLDCRWPELKIAGQVESRHDRPAHAVNKWQIGRSIAQAGRTRRGWQKIARDLETCILLSLASGAYRRVETCSFVCQWQKLQEMCCWSQLSLKNECWDRHDNTWTNELHVLPTTTHLLIVCHPPK